MLRIGILTTDTLHHRYFLRELHRRLPNEVTVVINLFEERGLPHGRLAWRHFKQSIPNIWRGLALNPYAWSGVYGEAIRALEQTRFFPNGDDNVPTAIPTHRVHSVNDVEPGRLLEKATPDLLLVYGTGWVKPAVFDNPPLGTVNAHGGMLPGYRGLDTNLWAAYEGRPNEMAVTLHRMDAKFDAGPIYLRRRIAPIADLSLITLRYYATLICTDMFVDLIEGFAAGPMAPMLREDRPSRYYPPMPALLKPKADRALKAYARLAA